MKAPARLEDIPFSDTLAVEPGAPPARDVLSAAPARRRAAWLYWVHHTRDGLLGTLVHQVLKRCPAGFASGFGKMVVPLMRWSYRKKVFPRRIAANFHALSRGRWPDADAEARAFDRWWRNISRTMAEFSVVNNLWRDSRIEVEGMEYLEAARRTGGPLLFTSMHLGTWEALFVAIHEGLAGPSIGPFQPEPNRFKNRIVHALRKQRGQYLFPPGQRSALRLRRLMATGRHSLTIFIDEVRDKQVHLPLFGRPAPDRGNAVVAIKLANTCGGTLLPTYLTRTGPARFKMVILPPLARPAPDAAYDVAATVLALNEVFEPVVLRHIEEWYMLAELRLPGVRY